MQRILSIDIFRGLTIFVMVFVNDLAGVSGLPDWMYHVAADADAMTFVDVVFPAFLIIVGMSIPLAIGRRFEKGEQLWEVLKHIAIRSIGLIVLGVFMVNAAEMNTEATPIPKSLWNVLFYLSVILIWNRYPKSPPGNKKYFYLGLQLVGIVTLIALWILFRKGEPGQLTGMTPSWWGILGLIGWAYLLSSVIYLIVRNNLSAFIGILGLLLVMVIGLRHPDIQLPVYLAWLKNETGHLIHTSLVISGVIMTLLLQQTASDNTGKTQIKQLLLLGGFSWLAGFFLRPLYGISKIYATPTWALYSIAFCCVTFVIIYWIVEVRHIKRWANFLTPAGVNPLLTYILPFIFYAVVGFSYLPDYFNSGALGFIRSVLFSLAMLWVSSLLTKRGIVLKL